MIRGGRRGAGRVVPVEGESIEFMCGLRAVKRHGFGHPRDDGNISPPLEG